MFKVDKDNIIITGMQGELFMEYISLSKALKNTMSPNVFKKMLSVMLCEVEYE